MITTVHGADYLKNFTLKFAPSVVWSLGSLVAITTLQLVLNLCVFFTGPRHNKWLRHRFWCALARCMARA